ncbi:hypothetical protein Rleg4DRAFT_4381 [Rhizobium leguminosarum bv. trifolii WSM2297]|uniref:Uncharacterized protein n=1 Tax=Rhizobium leguminosarum bv. trifolii WSM2297 TaxID=754762 RepID=J0CGP1_RHILT|nr:hypothetical protein [Rhizobium leguminosarum]EJC82662.1 hypothetical protein Rleg4DRAFT_4381 [Rhizobium leguminosarum bv. trifolii WSM2297]
MASNLWDTEHGAMFGANSFAAMNILYLLLDKGLISREDAAGVLTKTATQVREGSEDGAEPQVGEQVARKYEAMAAWCLGYSPGQ